MLSGVNTQSLHNFPITAAGGWAQASVCAVAGWVRASARGAAEWAVLADGCGRSAGRSERIRA